MGDTLAGIAGALLARGVRLLLPHVQQLIINGTAGLRAAKLYGEAMLLIDLIEQIRM